MRNDIYIALHPKLALRNDGDRIILYLLSFLENKFFSLNPKIGFALSMLDGETKLNKLEEVFNKLFPESEKNFLGTIFEANKLISNHANLSDFGLKTVFLDNAARIENEGIFITSQEPIKNIRTYNPRNFIVKRDKYFKKIQDSRQINRLTVPISLIGFFTNRCQTNCIYCYAENPMMKEMDYENWLDILDQMVELDIKIFNFGGGDILAHPKGVDFLIELCKRNILFILSTKCFINKENARKLSEVGIQNPVEGIKRPFQISIDAVDEDLVNFMTGSSIFFDKISKTIDNLIEVGLSPKIKTVLLPINADQPMKIVSHFYEKGIRNFSFVFYNRSFFKHDDDYFLNKENANLINEQIEKAKIKYPDAEIENGIIHYDPIAFPMDLEMKKSKWNSRVGCSGGRTTLGIAANGKAILCEQTPQNNMFYVGDFNQQTIMDIWNSKEVFTFIYPSHEKFKDTVCFDCGEYEICHWKMGTCFRDVYFSYNTLYDAAPLCPIQEKNGLRLN